MAGTRLASIQTDMAPGKGQETAGRQGTASGGFTLAELIVVLAIVSILTSLLLPQLSQARVKALSTRCAGNLRQVGFGLILYLDDHEAYPFELSTTPGEISEELRGWPDLLMPYLAIIEENGILHAPVLACPSREGDARDLPDRARIGDYGVNAFGYQNGTGARLGLAGVGPPGKVSKELLRPTRDSDVMNPSDMIAVADGAWTAPTPGDVIATPGGLLRSRPDLVVFQRANLSPMIRRAQLRHGGRVNTLFSDGHVRPMPLWDLFSDESDSALRRWNRDNEPHRE